MQVSSGRLLQVGLAVFDLLLSPIELYGFGAAWIDAQGAGARDGSQSQG